MIKNNLRKMVNKINLLLLCCLLFGCVSQSNKIEGVILNENTEWSHTGVVSTNTQYSPKYLLWEILM